MTNIIFLDLETTGLDPDFDQVLEIGMVAYDPVQHRRVATFQEVFYYKFKHSGGQVSPVVKEMHTANGLWEQCLSHGVNRLNLEPKLVDWVEEHTGQVGSALMCGNTINFDRSFIRVTWPIFDSIFQYRMLDVTTLGLLADKFDTGLERVKIEKSNHRALADCHSSIEQLEGYLAQLEKMSHDELV